MRFRRHSRRSRRPTFWDRACFTNNVAVAASHTSLPCSTTPVLAIDEMAPGNPEFTQEDRRYTVRRIRVEGSMVWTMTALSGPHHLWAWAVTAVVDIGHLNIIVTSGVDLDSLLNGGSTTWPTSADILNVQTFEWSTGNGLSGSNGTFLVSQSQHWSLDVKVARRLQSAQCIATFWGTEEIQSGISLPSASGWGLRWNGIRSVLYSETGKR